MLLHILFSLVIAAVEPPFTVPLLQGRDRIEIIVERMDGQSWREIDSRLILNRDDRVRFRVKTSFDGYLYVTNQSTSGNYDNLFPGPGTKQENRIQAGQEYVVPQSASLFRITDPPGQEIVYFLVSPLELRPAAPGPSSPGGGKTSRPPPLLPRCDDTILRARGDCIDTSAGPKAVGETDTLPHDLAGIPNLRSRDLTLIREQNSSVISSAQPLNGPVIYEVRLSHR